ncbi:MAG: YkgJ family cysteine cluster protein [Gammaproteobacteria bacterium]|nr:MAG: YkgJ family cysteine cluster protein [Gammaproteobacteria bacterium]
MSKSYKRIKIVPEAETITPENKCSFCIGSICCTYITQQIDTPKSKKDFEHLLWQVSHENIRIYKDEDGWTLLVETRCRHLQLDGGCGIYETRPSICREHSNDYCEYDEPSEQGFDLYFPDYESLLKYCRKKFKKWPY